ncbi:MAG: glycosyltransferase [Azoarcus sp.]|nr:glycosyltransferase [Azoarcus sp.]
MIPRIIHQTWKTREVPEHLRGFARSWQAHHPGWEHRLWTDADNRDFLVRHYPHFLPYYDAYASPICRVDAIRCFLLKHFGGLYADLDFECLVPFDDLLDTDTVILGEEPARHAQEHCAEHPDLTRVVCNALMASPPGHPFWDHVIECMIAAHHEPGPLNATGPFLLTRAVETYRGDAPVRVLPASDLYPISDVEQRSGAIFDLEFWLERTRGAHAVHHWAGTWWRGRADIEPLTPDRTRAALVERGTRLGDVMLSLRAVQPADAPLVSCLMVTRNRAPTARLAIDAFLRQTWPARELVILDDGEDDALRNHVATLDDARIRIFRPDGPRANLGELRNRAVALARGEYVCQWDDDDLYDPARIASQMAALYALRAEACFLERWTIWWPAQDRLALSTRRVWEGSMLCLKAKLPPYPALARGEDSPVADHILAHGRVVLLDQPRLYLYVVHGANTFGAEHFDRHWEGATLQAEGACYARLRQELGKRLPLDDYPVGNTTDERASSAREPAIAVKTPAPRPTLRADNAVVPAISRLPADATPHVLLLTPLKNAARFLPRYFELACALEHPRERLSLAFLEGDSDDGTPELLRELVARHAHAFARVEILHRDFGRHFDGERSAADVQYVRRSVIAKCRNALFRAAHRDEEQVLWVDADLVDYPPDVLTRLLNAERQIVVPHCVRQPGGETFDLNTFRFAAGARNMRWAHMLDGITQPPRGVGRQYLQDLRGEPLVEVDGVGGTMLLVDAAVHRTGILFPDYSYRGFIETEGFAMMARDRGIRCWGMPDLEVVHVDH